MVRWSALLGLLALLVCVPLLAQSDLQARIRNLKLQDAALRAVEESMAQLTDELAPAEALAGAMLEDPARYQTRDISQSQLRAEEAERLHLAFRHQLERFARHVEDLPEAWVEHTLETHQERVAAVIEPLLDGPFNARFEEARQLAVGAQAGTLEADQHLLPDTAAVESLVDSDTLPWLSREELANVVNSSQGARVVNDIVASIAAEVALFSENQLLLGDWSRQILSNELAALQRQLQQVQSYRGGTEVSREAMDADINAGFDASPAGVVFPIARQRAAERAAFLEIARFRDFVATELDPQVDCPRLDNTLLETQLAADFHHWPSSLEDHLVELRSALVGTLGETLVAVYQSRPGAEVAGFGERLKVYLQATEQGSVGELLVQALADCLEPKLTAVRLAAAWQEFEATHPEVAHGSLSLPDESLVLISESSLAELDSLQVPGLPDVGDLHLDETLNLFQQHRQAILQEGRFALDTQLNTVTWHQAEFTEQIRADPDRQANREDWQQAYEQRVYQDWRTFWEAQADDPASPVLLGDKYLRLFEPTRQLIADLLPTDWQPEASGDSQEQSTPETPPQEGGCEAVVDSCLQAAVICAEAAQSCQMGSCESPLLACRSAKERCESASRILKSQQAAAPPGALPLAQMCTLAD